MSYSRAYIDPKSDEKAIALREAGNVKFSLKKYLHALILYNMSISYACTKNALSLGYANRSAVYLEIEYYDECLKNIEWARENDYPNDKLSKLDDREQKCNKYIMEGKRNVVEDPWNFFQLSYPPNKNIPWIVDRLEVRTTEKYGRGIYATKDLKAGDIISVEEPIIQFLGRDGLYKHCNNCFKTCNLNLIPGDQTALMMFCSTDCMENFYSKSIEMDMSLQYDMNLLSEIAEPFGGYEKLDDFVNKTDLKDLKKTIFDFDLNNPEDPEYRKNLMICFLSLQPKTDHQINEGSCNIYNFVSKKTANHILGIAALNLSFTDFRDEKMGFTLLDATNISLFRSLINHSCLNNVNFFSIDNKQVGYVVKPIKAGDQIFGVYFDKHTPQNSQKKYAMMQRYNFKCDCQECLDNSFQLFIPLVPLPYMFISRKDYTTAKDLLKFCCNRLQFINDYREIFTRQFQLFQVLTTFAYIATFPC